MKKTKTEKKQNIAILLYKLSRKRQLVDQREKETNQNRIKTKKRKRERKQKSKIVKASQKQISKLKGHV